MLCKHGYTWNWDCIEGDPECYADLLEYEPEDDTLEQSPETGTFPHDA